MYTTKDGINWDDACMPPAIGCEPCDSIQLVVGAAGCGYRSEPLHIGKILRWRSIGSENLWDDSIGYFEDHSHLYYTMTCLNVRLGRLLHTWELTIHTAYKMILTRRFAADQRSVKSGRYLSATHVLLFRPDNNTINDFGTIGS